MLILHTVYADYNVKQEAVTRTFECFFLLALTTMGLCKSFSHNLLYRISFTDVLGFHATSL